MSAPREFSHPVLWTTGLILSTAVMGWVFFHWLEVGMRHGRDAGPVKFAAPKPAAAVDHFALIADRSTAVLERGQQLYLRNCASCHGPEGDRNMTGSTPPPRNLKSDPYKAEWGGGPYGFYLTLTKGWGQGMPGFANLEPRDRYAIVHFVRETWQQGKDIYVAEDPPEVIAQIPRPGAVTEGPRTPPHLVPQPERLHPLLAVAARDGTAAAAQAQDWLRRAADQAEPAERRLLLRAAAGPAGWVLRLRQAASSGDRERTAAELIHPDSGDPELPLAPASAIDAAVTVLIAAAGQRT